ncbi:Mitochondrial distribution and morphology protein 12 [Entomortierella beljakovae]|nr:Mitochondrial distribution and morphology protein 12 [Entomortierella beljakovae]
MSFVFEWDKLDDEVALQIENMIHAHFQRISKPSFMGNIAVSKFHFGSTPPNVTVLDVTDPLDEWYVHMDQEEARLAQEAAEAGGGESLDEDELASGDEGEEYEDEYSYSDSGSLVMVGEGDDVEYLGPETFGERQLQESDEWTQRQQQRAQRNYNSSSGSSFKEELELNSRPRGSNLGRGSTFEQDSSTGENHRNFRSAVTSPARVSRSSPSSTSSSNSFGRSLSPLRRQTSDLENKSSQTLSKRNARNLKVDIDRSDISSKGYLDSPINPTDTSPKKSEASLSLSSHPSDDEIESEAFHTQGESTIFQRMKNLVLEPSILSSRPASAEGDSPIIYYPDPPQLAASTLSSTSTGGTLGAGFGGGVSSSPGTVLSTVMQNRTTTRPLSVASFYSSPTSTAANSSGQPGQISFQDISNMVTTGNSLLGLRAGSASKTMPSTPRGFESPTLSFSRRQSFSETAGEDSHSNITEADKLGSTGADMHMQNHSPFLSPVEALNFEALHRQPKVVERLRDPEDAVGSSNSRNGSQSGRSQQGDQRSRSNSMPIGSERRTTGSNRGLGGIENLERRRRRKRKDSRARLDHDGHPMPSSSYTHPPPIPSKRHENDIQMLLSVLYQGQMGFTVETELLLNYPTFAFLALPVKLVITGFSLKAVLKNVVKIERFVVEQLRKFITEDFVYPSYHSIELLRAQPPAPPTSSSIPSSTQTRSEFSEQSTSSRGASTSQSSVAASVAGYQSNNITTPPSISDLDDYRRRGNGKTVSHSSASSTTASVNRSVNNDMGRNVYASSSSSVRTRLNAGPSGLLKCYMINFFVVVLVLIGSPFTEASPVPFTQKDLGDGIFEGAQDGLFDIILQYEMTGVILIALGLFLCFFGYRVYRFILPVIVFGSLGSLVYYGMTSAGVTSRTLMLSTTIAVGIIGKIILVFSSRLKDVIFRILAMIVLGLWVLVWKYGGAITDNTSRTALLLFLAVLGLHLGLSREKEIAIVGSTILGAYSFVIGIDKYTHTGFSARGDSFLNSNKTIGVYILSGTFIAMALLGMIIQFWGLRRVIRSAAAFIFSSKSTYNEKLDRTREV